MFNVETTITKDNLTRLIQIDIGLHSEVLFEFPLPETWNVSKDGVISFVFNQNAVKYVCCVCYAASCFLFDDSFLCIPGVGVVFLDQI